MNKTLFCVLFFCFFQLLKAQTEQLDIFLNNNLYKSQFTGFYIFDPIEKKEIYNYNKDKFFKPASNTKIFTLYAALNTLGDSIPALKYYLQDSILHIQGTGDPTFLHPKFNNPKVLNFLKENGKQIVFHWNNFNEESFLPGWTWDDFRETYAPERSQFPIHENLVYIKKSKNNKLTTFPLYFKDKVTIGDKKEMRDFYNNKFYINNNITNTKIPFIINENVIKNILEELTNKEIILSNQIISKQAKILYSNKSTDIYRYMMEESDNFIAEQLLLLISNTIQDKLSGKSAIDYIIENKLKNIKQIPNWVDGSGLSQYNLFTPQHFVDILYDLYINVSEENLFNLFPVGGKTGTLKKRFKDQSTPYVFAKTGTLLNTITLSGFIKCKSGNTYIFSLLNNNISNDIDLVRKENDKLINFIRDNY